MQALGPDLLEAAAHAKTMGPEEVEETIDYLLKEVYPPAAAIADPPLTFVIECSMREIPFVEPDICRDSETEPNRLPSQLFPPHVIEAAKRYRFDGELKKDPVEYRRIYEELKIEAALLVIVCTSIPLCRFRTRSIFY